MKRYELSLALVLALLQGGLLVGIAFDKSETIDEPVYLIRSSRLFASWPAVPRPWLTPQWAFAAALWIADPSGLEGRADLGPGLRRLHQRHPESWRPLLLAGRFSTMLVTLAAGLWLWRTARRFGAACGLAAQALWVLSPTVLAHGGLANVDAWAAAWAALLLLCGVRFVEQPTWTRAAQAGVAVALAVSTKAPTITGVLPVVAVMAWAVLGKDVRGRGRMLVESALALGVASVVTLWAVYGFPSSPLWAPTAVPTGNAGSNPLPSAGLLEGLVSQATYGVEGKLSYLFGEVRTTGWWWFYLAVLGLKVTVGAQLLFAARVLGFRGSAPSERRIDLALLAGPCLLLLLLSLARAQGGVRYLLPAFPFAIVFLARSLPEAQERLGRCGLIGAGVLVLVGGLEALSVYPHALMFFNAWVGGPTEGPRYLIYGDDWGQDKRRLGQWQRENNIKLLYYARYGRNPAFWGVKAKPAPCTPQKGVFALQAEEVHRHGNVDAGCLDWLTLEPPDERLGYSIYIYQVDKRRLQRLADGCSNPRPFFRSGQGTPCDRFREKERGGGPVHARDVTLGGARSR